MQPYENFLISNEAKSIRFPHPSTAMDDGLLAVGGTLSRERLLLAYTYGIFPWYNPGESILWWHPDPRFVIFTDSIKVSKSMRSYFNKEKYRVTFDTCFQDVMLQCKTVPRDGQQGTWISGEFIDAYTDLHEIGLGHSVEVWEGDELIGGLYGVSLGNVFFGESMFSKRSNSSKFALITLAKILRRRGFSIIDCQMPTDHLKSMGGEFISRKQFLHLLRLSSLQKTLHGSWKSLMDGINTPELIK